MVGINLIEDCRYAQWVQAPEGYAAAYCTAISAWCPVMSRMYLLQVAELPILESDCLYAEYFSTQEGVSAVQLQRVYGGEAGAKNYFPVLVKPLQAEVRYEVLQVKNIPKPPRERADYTDDNMPTRENE